MSKPGLNAPIHRMPVESLSLIFDFLKDAIIDADLNYNSGSPRRVKRFGRYIQRPSQSLPLLVGAVCKKWREITLTTPWLWTDLILNLDKSLEGQLQMARNWISRSSLLPLDISIIQTDEHGKEEYDDILFTLKSVVAQWRDISLEVLSNDFLDELFSNLPEAPRLRAIFLAPSCTDLASFEIQRPLRPRYFISSMFYVENMPFNWDRLVFLDIEDTGYNEILTIISHARNLQRCIATGYTGNIELIPNVPIISHSLIYLKTNCNILGYLNLPSLLHLDYKVSDGLYMHMEPITGFLVRSRPPLSDFTIQYFTDRRQPIPLFIDLPEITSLCIVINDRGDTSPNPGRLENFLQALTQPSANAILPRLERLSLKLNLLDLPTSLWSLIGDLFPQYTRTNPVGVEAVTETANAFRRPLSRVEILWNSDTSALPLIPKDSLLRLLKVRKAGVALLLDDKFLGDLFLYMAKAYGIEL